MAGMLAALMETGGATGAGGAIGSGGVASAAGAEASSLPNLGGTAGAAGGMSDMDALMSGQPVSMQGYNVSGVNTPSNPNQGIIDLLSTISNNTGADPNMGIPKLPSMQMPQGGGIMSVPRRTIKMF